MRQMWLILALMPIIWSVCVGVEDWTVHHDDAEVQRILYEVHDQCKDRTRVYTLPDPARNDVPDETFEGRKLWVIEFSTSPGQHEIKKPEFKYIANMHGNEVIGKELLLRLAVLFCDILNDKDVDIPSTMFDKEAIKTLLDSTRIHLMPTMNPDGWAKANAVEDKTSQQAWLTGRPNGRGVDLNRNFPDLDKKYYLTEDRPYHHNNHLIRLTEALKDEKLQPETKMVMAWIHSNPFVISANMHGGDLVANFPFDEAKNGHLNQESRTPDHELFVELAQSYSLKHKKMADKNRKKCDMDEKSFKNGTTNGASWYSVPGGMQDYNYLASNCFEITLELGCVKFPPGSQLPMFWEDNFDAMINYMFQAHLGVKGVIKVPETEERLEDIPVVIKVYEYNPITRKEVQIDHDILSTKYGDYFRLLSNGTYTIKAVLEIPDPENDRYYQFEILDCITVENQPENGAQILNFDFNRFSNVRSNSIGKGCPEQARLDLITKIQQYYDNLEEYDPQDDWIQRKLNTGY